MRVLLVILALVACPVVAAAQPSVTPVTDSYAKDPAFATLAAVGTTVVAFGVAAYAVDHNSELILPSVVLLMAAPSAGHFYADEDRHAVMTTLIRSTAALAFVGGLSKLSSEDTSVACLSGERCDNDHHMAKAVASAGLVALVAATAYDLWDAHRAAERTNRKRNWALNPTLAPGGAGFVIGGRF